MALNYGIRNLSLENDSHIMVAGIDFGTTFSAYAFSFISSPNEIRMNKNWGSLVGCESYKAPTCVLTSPDGSFDSFGYEAESKYSQLDAEDTQLENGYQLYRHFKMILHKQGAKTSSVVSSTAGCIRPAMDIFSMSLKYLKDHMINAIQVTLNSPPDVSMIRWVVTVPAIWTDESKRFMREAAHKAGLISEVDSRKLVIALEPEAASVFCRSLDLDNFVTRSARLQFRTGDKFVIIDAGGGTIDITVHETLNTGGVKEIIPASGGPWGGIRVDENFITLLQRILSPVFVKKFQREHSVEWMNFMLAFEKMKKSADPENVSSSVKIPIPWSLGTEYAEFAGKGIDKVLNANKANGVSFSNGNLVLAHSKLCQIFNSVVSNTIEHVKSLLQDQRLTNINYILLVGGFGECRFLQKACTEAFNSQAPVLIPVSAQLCIIKGAVMYGHNTQKITSRIARYTYGMEMNSPFIEGLHDPNKVIWLRGHKCSTKTFSTFIRKDQVVNVQKPYTLQFSPDEEGDKSDDCVFYRTEKHNPVYTDEADVQLIGKFTFQNADSTPFSNSLELRATFGGTELLLEVRDISKGEDFPMSLTVDFTGC